MPKTRIWTGIGCEEITGKEHEMQTTIAILAAVVIVLALAALFPMVAILLTALGIVFMFLAFR